MWTSHGNLWPKGDISGHLLFQSPPTRKPLPRVRKPNLHSDRGQDLNPCTWRPLGPQSTHGSTVPWHTVSMAEVSSGSFLVRRLLLCRVLFLKGVLGEMSAVKSWEYRGFLILFKKLQCLVVLLVVLFSCLLYSWCVRKRATTSSSNTSTSSASSTSSSSSSISSSSSSSSSLPLCLLVRLLESVVSLRLALLLVAASCCGVAEPLRFLM
ncbi:hypothetical protein E2C01_036379 [Portunus trituberculatus]|uniref:Uncharacterized protein n=1 Tax=Portunus trituberculatus TaxID=210409 RepID=A0A5B7FCA6_PORTR|nr:hypothetical protein [Portunus trituberculatus]